MHICELAALYARTTCAERPAAACLPKGVLLTFYFKSTYVQEKRHCIHEVAGLLVDGTPNANSFFGLL